MSRAQSLVVPIASKRPRRQVGGGGGGEGPSRELCDTRGRMISERHSVAERLSSGDERALAELYDQVGASAYSLALAIVRDAADAEEVVAEAFSQVWRSAPSFDASRGSPAAWVMTITRSRALDLLRSRRRQGRLLEQAAAGSEDEAAVPLGRVPSTDEAVELREVRERVRESLATLPEEQRLVIEMAYFGGLSQSEIAADLDQPLGTVKTRMRAGMEKLRRVLTPLRAEVRQ